MKKVFVMMGMLLSLGLFCACSSDSMEQIGEKLPESQQEKSPEEEEGTTQPEHQQEKTSEEQEGNTSPEENKCDSMAVKGVRYWGWFKDVTGQMTYNEDLQAWHFISRWPYAPVGPTLDLYPIELEDEFKVEGLVVTLSGDIFIDDENQRIYIELTKIERNSNYPTMDKEGFFPMDTEECFSGQVIEAKDGGDSIKVIITETPEEYSFSYYAPHTYCSVSFLKSDLLNPDIREGDTVDFRIVSYKMLSIIYNGPETNCNEFFCSVKPCK